MPNPTALRAPNDHATSSDRALALRERLDSAADMGLSANIARFLRFLGHEDGDVIELQALGVPGKYAPTAHFTHVRTVADAVAALEHAESRTPTGSYVLFNTVDPAVATEQPDLGDALGVRDRAILEVLYSTGIRRSELVRLGVYDLDAERGTLTVRQGKGKGKGKKDRVVPIGKRTVHWVERYLHATRDGLVMPPDEEVLFLTRFGEAFKPEPMTHLVRGYVDAADLGKTGACHLFRHTCATLMHEAGADIRHIQELLGHAELSTTQVYTQVAIRQLKAVHSATHPGAALPRPPVTAPVTALGEPPDAARGDAAELQAVLDADDDEDAG
ncbi:MAG: tyrosine-type recombinase/integrase [Polyangiaceae bacterium]|nr:tyrosine-type recombinase/integrase [Polyangiaceae bacterium]